MLEAILQAQDRFDGSIGIRCSCRQAICGSCGVRVNGEPALACHTHLDAAKRGARDGVIEIEPMGNMPVIKDLIVDMDAVHWKKIQRVTPWLLAKQPVPEREYIVSERVDGRRHPDDGAASSAARACRTAWRWRSTPASSARRRSPRPTASSATRATTSSSSASTTSPRTRRGSSTAPTASSACEACPKDVNPMGQIMRLRRIATDDHHIVDQNNGERHEAAFTALIKDNGLLWEAELLPRSYGGNSWFGKFAPGRRQRAAELAAGRSSRRCCAAR